MLEPDLFAVKPGAFNRSPDPSVRSGESYDIHSITKKIQEQTKNIEDEIKKVADLLKR
jgi:hypothetical protein